MDYKKIIPNQQVRFKLLKLIDFLPDKFVIKMQYKLKTGRKLDLKKPKRFTEKLQWYKLYYRKPLLTQCSDKYLVRNYVKDKGLENTLNDLYGVYDNVEQIKFDELPNSFIIKLTNGSGANLIVDDKRNADINTIKNQVQKWLEKRAVNYGREWGYYDVETKIIIERLLERDDNNDLPDYKFFCFNGKVKYLYTMVDYVDNHSEGKCSFFTPDFEKLPYRRSEYAPIDRELKKPENFDQMVTIAEKLSEDFPHVRVDLYNIDGKILFGELTFYNASGYTVFTPDEFDFILGKEFDLLSIS